MSNPIENRNTLNGLKAVAELLSKPEAWIQDANAAYRDENGRVRHLCGPYSVHEPNCWCLIGAMRHVNSPNLIAPIDDMVAALGFEDRHDMIFWNDTTFRQYSEVRLRLNTGIGKLERQLQAL